MKQLVIFCCALMVTGLQTLFAQTAKVSMTAPAGWARKDTTKASSGTTIIKFTAPTALTTKGGTQTIQLVIQKNSPDMASVESKLKDAADSIRENGAGQLKIDNTDASWFEVTIKRKTVALFFTERYYHLAKNNLSYTFVCIIPGEDISPMQPQIDGVLASFRVQDN